MSRSYKKQEFYSADAGKMKEWKQTINRRDRSKFKQKLKDSRTWENECYETFKNGRDRWCYPKDEGRRWRRKTPLLNQCEVDKHDALIARPYMINYYRRYWKFNNGHHQDCKCYTNKRSDYWKMMRK